MVRKLVVLSCFLFTNIVFAQMVAAPPGAIVTPAPVTVAPAPEPIIPSAVVNPPAAAIPDIAATTATDQDKPPPLPPCPPPSAYPIPPGYRLAGISPPPSCQGVPIPMFEPAP